MGTWALCFLSDLGHTPAEDSPPKRDHPDPGRSPMARDAHKGLCFRGPAFPRPHILAAVSILGLGLPLCRKTGRAALGPWMARQWRGEVLCFACQNRRGALGPH